MSYARIMGEIVRRSSLVRIPSQNLTEQLAPFSSSPVSQHTTSTGGVHVHLLPVSPGITTTTSTHLATHHTTFQLALGTKNREPGTEPKEPGTGTERTGTEKFGSYSVPIR
jgi:hypothetical protein